MDKIRINTVLSLQEDFVSKGENCNCWDRIRYLLPCPCIIHANPGELPLKIVHKRWRFEHDDSFEGIECAVDTIHSNQNQDETSGDTATVIEIATPESKEEEEEEEEGEEEEEDEEEEVEYLYDKQDSPEVEAAATHEENKLDDKTDEPVNNKERMLLKVEKLLYSIHRSINSFETQQEIADAIKALEEAEIKIVNPEIRMDMLKPPSTNLNRQEGKKVEERDEKNEEEYQKKKRLLEIEERHAALEQKKRKLTVLVRDDDGSFIMNRASSKETIVKHEVKSSIYDSIQTYSDQKKDSVFKWLNVDPLKAVSAIHSVGADGNCGFRAVSLGVYQDQTKWSAVKDEISTPT
ncbi:hypothetical protein BC941DRAFT_477526 [Chlamydoabsidia padenii]|nr:hypothetical protein BC941DRAFT_477526 [Chlamydoabsidia padenii]